MRTISKLIGICGIIFSLLSIGTDSLAQTLITGVQATGGLGSGTKIECLPLVIETPIKIVKITGNNAGFWIKKDGNVIQKFTVTNDPQAVGLELEPGTYQFYPYLVENQQKAVVTLTLELK